MLWPNGARQHRHRRAAVVSKRRHGGMVAAVAVDPLADLTRLPSAVFETASPRGGRCRAVSACVDIPAEGGHLRAGASHLIPEYAHASVGNPWAPREELVLNRTRLSHHERGEKGGVRARSQGRPASFTSTLAEAAQCGKCPVVRGRRRTGGRRLGSVPPTLSAEVSGRYRAGTGAHRESLGWRAAVRYRAVRPLSAELAGRLR
jgi:hypothetical protein